MCWVLCVVYKTLKLEVLILFANETVLYNVTIMFTTIAELEMNAYWRFYKTKRCSAYALGNKYLKNILCCVKQGRPWYWYLSEAVVRRYFSKKIHQFHRKAPVLESFFFVKLVTFLRTSFFYRTPPVAASDLSLVQIPKFEGQLQLCLLLLATLRVLFEETIIRTISSVIGRSTNKAF